MKPLCFVFLAALLLATLSVPNLVLGQQAMVSYKVTLNWVVLQVTYPSQVMPGGVVNVTVEGTPRNAAVYLQNLTATIYYGDTSGLHQLAAETLVANAANIYAYYGQPPTGSFSRSFVVNVPTSAPRTSLIAVFSEATQYNNYYNGIYPFSYWTSGNTLFYSFYPASTSATDQAISPLSYINATEPEYAALQAKYRSLQQQMNQTQSQNQESQKTITQQNAIISQLNQQLTSANTTAQTYQSVAAVFAIAAVVLAAFGFYYVRNKPDNKQTAKTADELETE